MGYWKLTLKRSIVAYSCTESMRQITKNYIGNFNSYYLNEKVILDMEFSPNGLLITSKIGKERGNSSRNSEDVRMKETRKHTKASLKRFENHRHLSR